MISSTANYYDEHREDHTINKIRQIGDRWKEIDFEIDREKQFRKENLEEQIHEVEQVISSQKADHQAKIAQLKEHITEVGGLISNEKVHRKEFADRKERELKDMEEALIKSIDQQQKAREDVSMDWLRQADERLISIVGQTGEVSEDTANNLEATLATAKSKINDLENSILLERKRREESTTQVTEAIEGELNRLHNVLTVEKKVRQATQGKLFKLVEEIQNKLVGQLQAQKRQREETNEALLRLLEETCNRVDKSFR